MEIRAPWYRRAGPAARPVVHVVNAAGEPRMFLGLLHQPGLYRCRGHAVGQGCPTSRVARVMLVTRYCSPSARLLPRFRAHRVRPRWPALYPLDAVCELIILRREIQHFTGRHIGLTEGS